MPKKNNAASLGGKISGQNRRLKQNARILKVKQMRDQDMSKAEIARILGVHYETILRDCKTFEDSTSIQIEVEVIDAVLEIARREVRGEITTLEARQEIQDFLALLIKMEKAQ